MKIEENYIRLLNYKGEKFLVEIPEEEDKIVVDVVSGDMVLTYPLYYDTGADTRWNDYYEGSVIVSRKDFERFNAVTDSSGIFELKTDDDE